MCLSHFGGLEYCCTMVYLPFFFYYNIIYLNFLLTKQNSGTTDQQYQNGLSASLFVFNCMSTLDGKVFRVHFMQAILSPQCTPTDLFHSLHEHAVTKPFVDSHSICNQREKENVSLHLKKKKHFLIF